MLTLCQETKNLINSSFGESRETGSSEPQGSILGPSLFNIMILLS